jgi:hypothetical protein
MTKPIHRFVAGALLVLLGLWAVSFFTGSFSDAPPERGAHSFSTDADGHRALMEVLDRTGIQASAWRGLPSRAPEGVYVLIEPLYDALDEALAETDALTERVERGGTLVIVRPRRGARMPPEQAARVVRAGADDEEFASPSWAHARMTTWRSAKTGRRPLSGAALSAEDGALSIDLEDPRYLALEPGWKSILATPEGTLAAERSVGQGRIIAVSEARLFANGILGHADHSVAAVRLLAYAAQSSAPASEITRPDEVRVDEFFHDLYRRPHAAQAMFSLRALPITVPLFAAIVVLAWAVVPRFGPARMPPAARRRRRSELLDAMAGVLSRGGRHGEVLDRFRKDLAADLRAALGLPARMGLEDVCAVLAVRGPAGARLAQALADSAPPRSEDEMAARCRGMDDAVKTLAAERGAPAAFGYDFRLRI